MNAYFSYISIAVSNLNLMIDFYRNVLNLSIEKQTKTYCIFQTPNIRIALLEKSQMPFHNNTIITGNICLSFNTTSVGEVDRQMEKLIVLDTPIIQSPTFTEWGGYQAFFKDPEDNFVEIVYNPNFKV